MFKPYSYQEQVLCHLLSGRSVILQAPTGAGKTAAALWPFLHAFRHDVRVPFPPQAIYSVPMRVLANQFFEEYRSLTHGLQLRENLTLTIQTGEHPMDPEFHGDLVFATLDQTLSSLLGVPYSLGTGRYNLNVAAVVGSYLVFDEFHLFPYQATRTLFHLLQHLRPVTPFVLMTATFSETLLKVLGNALGAEVVVVSEKEARDIASRGGQPPKRRVFYVRETPLTDPGAVRAVLEGHRRRTLVVLNTVDRAQDVYRALVEADARPVPFGAWVDEATYRDLAQDAHPQEKLRNLVRQLRQRLLEEGDGRPWVMLLHSRFSRGHRLLKEVLLRHLWGPEGLQAEQPSLIVVATQVVEVGLDISAETLHTELAPAAAVLQRAGRCARYPGEQGEVYVYPVPPDSQGNPNYAPYGLTKMEQHTVEATWEAFRDHNGQEVDFATEQAIVNQAHQEQDKALVRSLQESAAEVWEGITAALTGGEPGLRTELIRDTLTSRTVLVYDAPETDDKPPFGLEGFSLHIGTLHGKLRALLELREQLGLDWALRRLKIITDADEETAYRWWNVESPDDLKGAFLLAVHPRLAAYDAELGFRLAELSDGAYQSQPITRPRPPRPDYVSYRLECYHKHIEAMRQALEQGPWKQRFAWLAARLARQLGVDEALLQRALDLVLALHDVGKLQEDWQAWAWDYQRRIGHPLSDNHCLVAHTYSDGSEAHKQAARKARPRKPNHAGEGAHASVPVLFRGLEEDEGLVRAAVTAIARHHSPWVESANGYRLHPRAQEALAEALAKLGAPADLAQHLHRASDAPDLYFYLLEPPESRPGDPTWWEWWLYFALVRTLRLVDGMAVEGSSEQSAVGRPPIADRRLPTADC